MNEHTQDSTPDAQLRMQEHREFRTYVWGLGLALLLTLVPFALVYWAVLPYLALLSVIGVLAIAQLLVHFRFFLHITLNHRREDLQLIVFSALLLFIMVAGTLWILTNLALRMTLPG